MNKNMGFFCIISEVFDTQFWVLNTVYEVAMYNINHAAKSMKSHPSARIYKKIYKESWMF